MAGNYTACYNIETDNDLELIHEGEERKLLSMARVHNNFEMWQGSQNIHATLTASCGQNKQMTAVGYIAHTKQVIKASWSNFQHHGVAALTLSDKSPLPPAVSGKDIHGGQTPVLTVRLIKRLNHHPVTSDDDNAHESISNTEHWLNWIVDFDNPNVKEDNWDSDDMSEIALGNMFEGRDCPAHPDDNATQTVPGLIGLTRMFVNQDDNGLMTVTAMETQRNLGHKKM